MESSRIFVRNLPPTITEADFRKHFVTKEREITDIKVIPARRIGFVGFKTANDAAEAAKYFNRSYIRMSKISVELAKPPSDVSLRAPTKQRTGQTGVPSALAGASQQRTPGDGQPEAKPKKRKREDLDLSDPKLKEYMETMQSAAKLDGAMAETPVPEVISEKAMAALDGESDDEYEEIPFRPAKKVAVEEASVGRATRPDTASEAAMEVQVQPLPEPTDSDTGTRDAAATDDDWLRSRTNRLLDLVDADDPDAVPAPQVVPSPLPPTPSVDDAEQPTGMEQPRQDRRMPSGSEKGRAGDALDLVRKTSRLFVRNLPYSATEDDLRSHFERFGSIEEVHLPVGNSGVSKGYALVLFTSASSAVDAFQESDGCLFQGRILHVLPAQGKKESKLDEFAISKLPLKKQNLIRKKAEAASASFNWNALFMSQDAVNASVADRLGVSKSELLDPSSADASVKQAIAETSVIQETKAYFATNGVDLDAFKTRQRGDTTILVKNFSYGTTIDELRKMFEEHGTVLRVLMPPSGTIAIVEFAQAPHARAAFMNLAYRRVKDSVLFLEKGPKDLFKTQPDPAQVQGSGGGPTAAKKLSVTELLERDEAQDVAETTSLFVRGLNFATTTEKLAETFRPLDGFVSARVKTKTDAKKPGQVLSMGFGFVEFRTKEQAHAALKAMDGHTLEGHVLAVKASHRGLDAAEERRREDKARKLAGQRTKIIIKNLPFEATRTDVRTLFGTYGQLRAVRVPKNFGNRTRGFAFAEFTTPKEAENALNALGNTHLLGRKLVLEFAEAEAVDAEEEIAKMQKKTEGQVNKVALQKLIGRGARQKVTIGKDDGDEVGGGDEA
ncbi:multiple RNA-binding domain-containing protein 1 [Magnaporthiopsis poae ATCC 64411]|uniref:Multiple RNA-binding domain-containing protein 1 n=1 Tax=Magnaporthiopsis poae (strain ATCC 64411 / 73-15) TaxID=644358 RepID=A0A0C4DKU6_MAGP6|nr:multiple RNA-binding domain-containing protein 1 [Magnaporthiopsis poae ATCC 64411]